LKKKKEKRHFFFEKRKRERGVPLPPNPSFEREKSGARWFADRRKKKKEAWREKQSSLVGIGQKKEKRTGRGKGVRLRTGSPTTSPHL